MDDDTPEFAVDKQREIAIRYHDASVVDLGQIAGALKSLAPERSPTMLAVDDGVAVFLGAGLFVNRLLGYATARAVDPGALDEFEQQSASLGHVPAIEVSRWADPHLAEILAARGYQPAGTTSVLARPLALPLHPPGGVETHRFSIEQVDAESLETWCEATASGWGHVEPERRAASDLYARAAFETQQPGLLLARSNDDGRLVGAAALAMIGTLAILGGMSTVPAERQTGVQAAMIMARLRLAAELGGDIAATQAARDSGSHRNLVRSGFRSIDEVVSWEWASSA